jgi:hypothetical protein
MTKESAALLLLALCATAASAQIKSLSIGALIYIGEDSAGASYFALHLGETALAHPIPLASPVTFNSALFVLVGQDGTLGPFLAPGPFTTPTELLLNTLPMPEGHPCPCLVAAVQLVMSAEPTITITLKNGQSITTSSTVNVYLEAPHGMSAIQLQKPVPIIVHASQ